MLLHLMLQNLIYMLRTVWYENFGASDVALRACRHAVYHVYGWGAVAVSACM
jgi:hypothetical protein